MPEGVNVAVGQKGGEFRSFLVRKACIFVVGKDGGAGVAFLLGIVPVLVIVGKLQIYLAFLELRFLKAEDVGVSLMEKIKKAFLNAGA